MHKIGVCMFLVGCLYASSGVMAQEPGSPVSDSVSQPNHVTPESLAPPSLPAVTPVEKDVLKEAPRERHKVRSINIAYFKVIT